MCVCIYIYVHVSRSLSLYALDVFIYNARLNLIEGAMDLTVAFEPYESTRRAGLNEGSRFEV